MVRHHLYEPQSLLDGDMSDDPDDFVFNCEGAEDDGSQGEARAGREGGSAFLEVSESQPSHHSNSSPHAHQVRSFATAAELSAKLGAAVAAAAANAPGKPLPPFFGLCDSSPPSCAKISIFAQSSISTLPNSSPFFADPQKAS